MLNEKDKRITFEKISVNSLSANYIKKGSELKIVLYDIFYNILKNNKLQQMQ
ncbi:hypothetical protein CCAND93_490020 [Capnocytophaga canis]|uniref:Uncharacterized protein n=1 Tax=Capnocytophaga canis TaxID=1848903 RepID=A0A0B7ISM6_9FLAO|nr:hypothetical protein CCAND93_490020 [Capnocytophaga canis]